MTRAVLLGTIIGRVLPVLLLVLAWECGARLAGSRFAPPLSAVLRALWAEVLSGQLALHLGATLARVACAFAVAMGAGTVVGMAMGRLPALDRALDSLLTLLLNLPALVGIVLLYVWFGLSEATLIAAVALNKFPVTAVTVREGARSLDEGLIDMARSFRMGRGAILRHVVMPQMYPYLFGAARTGLSLIWKIVLVAELLGRSQGVGFQIQVYFQLFDVTGILAYTLAFIAVVQAIEWALLQPLERRASKWR